MKLAYADPPYPGQAKRWYGDHPSYGGEVDHVALIARLRTEFPDGWALSTSAAALRDILALSPAASRVAIWYRPNSEPPGNRGRWHWSWEPVIVQGGRQQYAEAPSVRDVLALASGRKVEHPLSAFLAHCATAGEQVDQFVPVTDHNAR